MIVRRKTNGFTELNGISDLPVGQAGLPAATPACAGTADRDAAQAGGVGGILGVDDAGQGFHFVAYDGNGNVMALVDADDGTVSAEYEYGPFGERIRSTGPMSYNPIRFSTKYHDTETGLVYYGYRYYWPAMGRWISRDHIGERGGWNIYIFVHNNSIDIVDLFGLSDEKGAECLMKMCKRDHKCPEDEKVSIWICKRKLMGPDGPYPKIGPLSHSFIVCEDPYKYPDTTEKYGKQPRASGQDGSLLWGPGYVVREPYNDFSDCREKGVCPQDKDRMCKEGPTESFYFIFSPWHNCHAWANGRCK